MRSITLLTLTILFSSKLSAQKATLRQDWHHLNIEEGFQGVNSNKANRFIADLKRPASPIVVAVIDGDLDILHEDLKDNLWVSAKSSNKYQGLRHGWNFLGTQDGKQISKVGTEAFREYKRLRPKYEGTKAQDWIGTADSVTFNYFLNVKKDAKIQGYLNFFPYIELTYQAFRLTDSVIHANKIDPKVLRIKDLSTLSSKDSVTQDYIDATVRSSMRYSDTTKWDDLYAFQTSEYNTAVNRIKSLDDLSNPRYMIGDDINLLKDKYYGNTSLVDSNSFHGTFVAGLIAANRMNNIGINGIAANVLLMGIRAVPDGDEFDKDIAVAIRFAVDHGANIINMSFGKYYSPNSKWVTDAIAYALNKNVLVVQAAGNDNKNLDSTIIYPAKPEHLKKKKDAYLKIASSNYKGEKSSFSNYGLTSVDFFAPGEKVTSTATFNQYKTANGTSFSAPIVSGVAALVWGMYPKLKAYQIADILKQSAKNNTIVDLEGYAKIPGIVDAFRALQIASEYEKN